MSQIMLSSYKSDTLTELIHHVCDVIIKSKKDDAFKRPWIIVQNKEVQQWLSLQIASKLGVIANIEFILPSELMWKLYRKINPDIPTILPSDRIPLQWSIFEVLLNMDEAALKNINGIPDQINEKQIFQFAAQIADVFDLYQMYRPEMLQHWNEGKLVTKDPNEFWQLRLWRSIKKELSSKFPDRSEALFELISKLGNNSDLTKDLPDEIIVFGLSHFSQPFAQLIGKLSETVDCHFFNQEIVSKENDLFSTSWNLLVEQWGDLKSDSIQFIDSFASYNLSITNEKTILNKLRSGAQAHDLIEIHSCHNSKREIEVLKNQLLALLNQDSNLKPEELLILVPDLNEYAHEVQRILQFSEGEPALPVYAPKAYSDSSILAFIQLLNFLSTNIKASDCVDLIETESFKSRFSFDEVDLAFIRMWIAENHIHYGLEQSESSFSFEKLIAALNTGYTMELDSFELYSDIAPIVEISTSDQLNLMSRFSSSLEFIKSAREQVGVQRTAFEWLILYKKWVIELNPNNSSSLLKKLERIKETIGISISNSPINYEMMRKWIISQVEDVKAASSGLGNGIVLSSYIPFRNIPFKVVAMLGMNESTFPRNPLRPSFDLIQNEPKGGERITKNDDKLLFLEILSSTEMKLYISYIGQDQYSVNERLPSIFVQKLIDVINEKGDKLEAIKEKLHGFDATNFQDQKSYSKKELSLSELTANAQISQQSFINAKLETKSNNSTEIIDINDLIKFYTHPAKYISQNVLGISFGYDEREIKDRELFTISSLDKYLLDEKIYEGLNSDKNIENISKYTKAKGLIPEAKAGEIAFSKQFHLVKQLKKAIDGITQEVSESIEIDVEIGKFTIKGRIDQVYDSNLVLWRSGKERAKDLIPAWIKHLILQINGQVESTFLVTKDDKKGESTISFFQHVKEPERVLNNLIDVFIEAHQKPDTCCLFPECSRAYFEALGNEKKDPIQEALKKWDSNYNSFGEGLDVYNSLIWRGRNPFENTSFAPISKLVWEELLEAKRVVQ